MSPSSNNVWLQLYPAKFRKETYQWFNRYIFMDLLTPSVRLFSSNTFTVTVRIFGDDDI